MDLINYYRLRKIASLDDYNKGALTTGSGIAGGLGLSALALSNRKYRDFVDKQMTLAMKNAIRRKRLAALGHAALAGAALGVPSGVGSGVGVAVPAKLLGVPKD